ncbi:hypothetical protein HDV00_006822 [Rhizophlyctis rosea]|nr:hypothetical protein HDV00_006822 [Rhizophlyctis rosea]
MESCPQTLTDNPSHRKSDASSKIPSPTSHIHNLLDNLTVFRTFNQTPLSWTLTFKDLTKRDAYASYLDTTGPSGLRYITCCGIVCYTMYFSTLFLEKAGLWQHMRMAVGGALLLLCLLGFLCGFTRFGRRWWKWLTILVIGNVIMHNVVTIDVLYVISMGGGVQPMEPTSSMFRYHPHEDITTHITFAACMFITDIHPFITIALSTMSLIGRILSASLLYTSNAREVATLGISLAATLIPVQFSLITYRINEAWIFHLCQQHGIDMRVLDVRMQYGIQFRPRSGRGKSGAGLKGSVGSVRTVGQEKRNWRHIWNCLLLRWDDPEMEEQHRLLSYETSWLIVLTYISIYFLKHMAVTLINQNLTNPSAQSVIGVLLTEAALIILYHVTRPYHRNFYTVYALICMICTTLICFSFMWQAVPYFEKCCLWNAEDVYTTTYLSDQRARFYAAICPVTGQMFNIGVLFRLPYAYQTFFVVLLPLAAIAAVQGKSLFWPYNFGICFVVALAVSYATEVQQRKVVRLMMLLKDGVKGGGGLKGDGQEQGCGERVDKGIEKSVQMADVENETVERGLKDPECARREMNDPDATSVIHYEDALSFDMSFS